MPKKSKFTPKKYKKKNKQRKQTVKLGVFIVFLFCLSINWIDDVLISSIILNVIYFKLAHALFEKYISLDIGSILVYLVFQVLNLLINK